jgi:ribosomal protein S18 acetylase RimI-like enzyme
MRAKILKSTIQTQLGEVLLRKAEKPDEAAVLAIMRDAAAWLEEKGIPQWKGVLTPKGEELVRERVKTGAAYLASLRGKNIGTLSIFWEDIFSWGEIGADGSAGYIHGLAVSRRFAGKEIGKDILNWAIEFIKTKKPRVRLDCMAENSRLCRYYEGMGFKYVNQKTFSTGFKINLYQIESIKA